MLDTLCCDGNNSCLNIPSPFFNKCRSFFRIYTDIVDLQQQDSLSMGLLRAAHKFKLSGLMGEYLPITNREVELLINSWKFSVSQAYVNVHLFHR